jgi:hypothetical protein
MPDKFSSDLWWQHHQVSAMTPDERHYYQVNSYFMGTYQFPYKSLYLLYPHQLTQLPHEPIFLKNSTRDLKQKVFWLKDHKGPEYYLPWGLQTMLSKEDAKLFKYYSIAANPQDKVVQDKIMLLANINEFQESVELVYHNLYHFCRDHAENLKKFPVTFMFQIEEFSYRYNCIKIFESLLEKIQKASPFPVKIITPYEFGLMRSSCGEFILADLCHDLSYYDSGVYHYFLSRSAHVWRMPVASEEFGKYIPVSYNHGICITT